MNQLDAVPVFKFSTVDYPERDRFHLWVKDNLCDCRFEDDGYGPFNAEATGAALGPLILSGRRWPDRAKPLTYSVYRNARRIRMDGQDSFRFTLLLGGRFFCRSMSPESIKTPGHLFFYDVAQLNDCTVEAGDVISIVVPRYLLPSHAALLHGHTLTSGVGRLLGDHLLSLFRNLSMLRQQDVPNIVQSTLLLMAAAVSPTADAVREASGPIHTALLERVRHYIDTHLLERDLTPERICRDIGLSRAKLYQLFEDDGGVMRQIRRRRLRHAYHVLGDPQQQHVRIAEIAWAHGFPDEKYFYRLFKAEFGHTPKETVEQRSGPVLLPYGKVGQEQRIGAGGLPGWTLPFGVLNN
ncbi:AraC family transcriptional regulator [Paraburkholderia sp. D15]|uniref:helix-turn-helix domain-containing protein n=1 Tax=Paraburkholderia sp. D15 TaxID=2880218 RepID=UPI0024784491|nr:AraC family transcriptional regulator [Paraburkholderia sp. D15]WGS49947.1 AraC family transcriptional regulator [Paraburkholderia sp. D15]